MKTFSGFIFGRHSFFFSIRMQSKDALHGKWNRCFSVYDGYAAIASIKIRQNCEFKQKITIPKMKFDTFSKKKTLAEHMWLQIIAIYFRRETWLLPRWKLSYIGKQSSRPNSLITMERWFIKYFDIFAEAANYLYPLKTGYPTGLQFFAAIFHCQSDNLIL